jgi:hypothetical protein
LKRFEKNKRETVHAAGEKRHTDRIARTHRGMDGSVKNGTVCVCVCVCVNAKLVKGQLACAHDHDGQVELFEGSGTMANKAEEEGGEESEQQR